MVQGMRPPPRHALRGKAAAFYPQYLLPRRATMPLFSVPPVVIWHSGTRLSRPTLMHQSAIIHHNDGAAIHTRIQAVVALYADRCCHMANEGWRRLSPNARERQYYATTPARCSVRVRTVAHEPSPRQCYGDNGDECHAAA